MDNIVVTFIFYAFNFHYGEAENVVICNASKWNILC
jgi:hypothetical protein